MSFSPRLSMPLPALQVSAPSASAIAFGVGAATLAAGLIAAPLGLFLATAWAALALARAPLQAINAHLLLRQSVLAPLALLAAAAALFGPSYAAGGAFVWLLAALSRFAANAVTQSARFEGEPDAAILRPWGLHALTLTCGLAVAFTAPHALVGLAVDLPHPPLWAPVAAGLLAAAGVFDWALRVLTRWRLGEMSLEPAAIGGGFAAMLILCFLVSPDFSAGVMALLAWRAAHAIRFAPPARRLQPSFTAVP